MIRSSNSLEMDCHFLWLDHPAGLFQTRLLGYCLWSDPQDDLAFFNLNEFCLRIADIEDEEMSWWLGRAFIMEGALLGIFKIGALHKYTKKLCTCRTIQFDHIFVQRASRFVATVSFPRNTNFANFQVKS